MMMHPAVVPPKLGGTTQAVDPAMNPVESMAKEGMPVQRLYVLRFNAVVRQSHLLTPALLLPIYHQDHRSARARARTRVRYSRVGKWERSAQHHCENLRAASR